MPESRSSHGQSPPRGPRDAPARDAPASPLSSPPPLARTPCRACHRLIDPSDAFCRYCGRRQALVEAWYYRPVWILVLAFAVLGPFALPLVWLSPKMTSAAKIATSLAITIYTVLLLYYSFVLIAVTIRHFSALGDLRGVL